MEQNIIVTDEVVKRLGLCGLPNWTIGPVNLSKDFDLSGFKIMGSDLHASRTIVSNVEEFLKALHKKFPYLGQRMVSETWSTYLPTYALVEVFRSFLIVGRNSEFFAFLGNTIAADQKAREFFISPAAPDFLPGDIVKWVETANGESLQRFVVVEKPHFDPACCEHIILGREVCKDHLSDERKYFCKHLQLLYRSAR